MIAAILNRILKRSHGASIDRYYVFKLFGFGAFLHNIHDSDPAGLYHSHPWSGVSIIFGSYTEEFKGDYHGPRFGCEVYRRHCRWINFISAKQHHRVIVSKPTWTLFVHLRKSNKWSIINEAGETVEAPWEGEKGHKDYSKALAATT